MKTSFDGITGVGRIDYETGTKIAEGGFDVARKNVDDISKVLNDFRQAIGSNDMLDGVTKQVQKLQATIDQYISNQTASNTSGAVTAFDELAKGFELLNKQLQDTARSISEANTAIGTDVANARAQQAQDFANVANRMKQSAQQLSSVMQNVAPKVEEAKQQMSAAEQQNQQVFAGAHQNAEILTRRAQTDQMLTEQLGVLTHNTKEAFDSVVADLQRRTGDYEKLNAVFQAQYADANKFAEDKIVQAMGELRNQFANMDKDGSEKTVKTIAKLVGDSIKTMKGVADLHGVSGNSVEFYRKSLENVRAAQNALEGLVKIGLSQAEAMNDPAFDGVVKNLRTTLGNITESAKESANQIVEQQKGAIEQAIKDVLQRQNSATQKNSPEYNLTTTDIMKQQMSGISYNALVAGADDAIMHLQQSRGKNSPWYQYVTTGNLLGDKSLLAQNMRNIQRHGYAAERAHSNLIGAINDPTLSNDERAKYIAELQSAQSPLVDSIKKTAGGMHFMTGGGKAFTEEDKKVLDAFKGQIQNALDNLTKSINAIEAQDPSNKTLEQLKKEQQALIDLKEKAEKAGEASSALSKVFNVMWGGLKKFKNLMAGGLSMLGLGALLSPLAMIRGGIQQEDNEGKRRYRTAKLDFYMGTDLNRSRMLDIADTEANKWWRYTNGMINEDEFVNYYSALAHGSGGHYGASQESAAKDMHTIAKTTMPIITKYDIGHGSAADFYKNFYKDAGMSAQEASQALVDIANTATSANIPVEKYVNTITQMASALRNQGTSAQQVEGVMNALVRRGMRLEDAQTMLNSVSTGNQNMAKDMNGSAFWGMMAGQGGNPFDLIAAGYKTHNADGSVNENWSNMMTQRVLTEANFMGAIGGGAGSAMGQVNMMDSLMGRGWLRKDASAYVDALSKGDTKLAADLFEKGEKHTDGGRQELAAAADQATEELKKAGSQVSVFQKLNTDLVDIQKKIGHAIRDYLSGPLEKFRQGFGKVLGTIVEWSGKLIDGVTSLMSGETLRGAANWASENSGTLAAGALLAPALIGGTVVGGKKLFSKFVSSGMGGKLASAGAKAGRVGALGSMAVGGLALGATVAGAFALSKLVSMFSSGEAIMQVKNEGAIDKNAIDATLKSYNSMLDSNSADVGAPPEYDAPQEIINDGFEEPDHYKKVWHDDFEKSDLKKQIETFEDPDIPYDFVGESSSMGTLNGLGLGFGTVASLAMFSKGYKPNMANLSQMWKNPKGFVQLGQNFGWNKVPSSMGKYMKYGLSNAKGLGALGAVLSIGTNAWDEYSAYQNDKDSFTAGQRAGRVGFKAGGQIIGGIAGAALGSVLGPVGTMAGGWLGSMAGGWAGEKLMNSKLGGAFGLADWQGSERKTKAYEDRVRQSEELYGDASKSIINSNNENHKAVGLAMQQHGIDVKNITQEEERYMNDLFEQLKQKGFDEQLAAFLAASQIGVYQQQAQYAADNDKDSLGEAERDYGRTIFGGKDPNEIDMRSHIYGAGSYLAGTWYGTQYDSDEKKSVTNTYLGAINQAISSKNYDNLKDFAMSLNEMGVSKLYDDYLGRDADANKLFNQNYSDASQLSIAEGRSDLARGMAVLQYAKEHQDSEVAKQLGSSMAHFYKEKAPDDIKSQIAQNLKNKDGSAEKKANDISGNPYKVAPDLNPSRAGMREKFLKTVREQLGKKYVFGANGPDEFDCSGLVEYGGKQAGLTYFGRQANHQYDWFKSHNALKKDLSSLAAGDTLYFDTKGSGEVEHTGVYIGNGKMIHASSGKGEVVETDLNDYWKGVFLGGGDLSAAGAEAGAPDSTNTAATDQGTVAGVMSALNQSIADQTKQMGEFAGLSDKELLRDKLATGQLIFDGSTGLSANGRYLSLRGARDNFRLFSGAHDKDMWGVGLNGAFAGDGTMKANSGVFALNEQFDSEMPTPRSIQLDGYEIGQKTISTMDKMAENMNEAHKAQLETYEKNREAQQAAIDKMDKSKQSAKIAITVIGNDGNPRKEIMSVSDLLTITNGQYQELKERLTVAEEILSNQ